MNEAIRDAIVEWLDAGRQRSAEAARRLGIPLAIERSPEEVLGVPNSDNSSSRSPFTEREHRYQLLSAAFMQSGTRELADELIQSYEKDAWGWASSRDSDFERQPSEWVSTQVLTNILVDYLTDLGSLEVADSELANRYADGLVEFLEGDQVVSLLSVPLAGLELSEPRIEAENVVLRNLTPDESFTLSAMAWPSREHSSPIGLHFPPRHDETVVMEIRMSGSKSDPPAGGHRFRWIVLAFQLLGFDVRGSGAAAWSTEPGPSVLSSATRFDLPATGEDRSCTADQLLQAVAVAKLIPDEVFSGPRKPRHVALWRFHLGAGRRAEDALIDYTIALEAFLLPDSRSGEYRFKFGLFGAHYLGSDGFERKQLFEALLEIYDLRSQIVHGASPPTPEDVEAAVENARQLAARMFTEALKGEWPSPEGLKQLTIS